MSDADSSASASASDEEFQNSGSDEDNVETLEEEELQTGTGHVDDEIRALRAEADMPLDELRALYAGMAEDAGPEDTATPAIVAHESLDVETAGRMSQKRPRQPQQLPELGATPVIDSLRPDLTSAGLAHKRTRASHAVSSDIRAESSALISSPAEALLTVASAGRSGKKVAGASPQPGELSESGPLRQQTAKGRGKLRPASGTALTAAGVVPTPASTKLNVATMSLPQLLAKRSSLLRQLRDLGDSVLDDAYPQMYTDVATGATTMGSLAAENEESLVLGCAAGRDEDAAVAVALEFGALLDAAPVSGESTEPSAPAAAAQGATLAPLVPARVRTHWDLLLEENKWLAGVRRRRKCGLSTQAHRPPPQDMALERRWKIGQAKKLGTAVLRWHELKARAALEAAIADEARRRRRAGRIAGQVTKFWAKVDKLVIFKHKSRLDAMRRMATDKHLTFLVGQTERYTELLASVPVTNSTEGRPASESEVAPKVAAGTLRKRRRTSIADDKDKGPSSLSRHCTETSQLVAETDASEDRSALHLLAAREVIAGASDGSESESDDFDAASDAIDDEETLEAEEALAMQERASKRLRGGDSCGPSVVVNATLGDEDELVALEAEASMDIDELRRRYGLEGRDQAPESNFSDSGGDASEGTSGLDDDSAVSDDSSSTTSGPLTIATAGGVCASNSASCHPQVALPFLLRNSHLLRPYQHDGLSWLVSMHDRRLNGILADEMGLGKTIQTIALLAYLASERCAWGPHLIVVPTSTLLNWEMEFKRWCPALKVLTYYGGIKERKAKRVGWSKPNSFHVCVTSYQMVLADAVVFRRKKWHFLILDEAHYIKNYQSQRWQTLLTFSSRRRLLLTGTPLQNSLMELWSLMHFLMPHLFRSQAEFKHWFSNPLTQHVEGGPVVDKSLVSRLHTVLRPFVLRRLKSEVATQMPKKFESVIMCRLSNRQRFLYEDFMSRSSTRQMLTGGNYMSMMNVLMQLRKVCNHPDLFEPRPIVSPLQIPQIYFCFPTLLLDTRLLHLQSSCGPAMGLALSGATSSSGLAAYSENCTALATALSLSSVSAVDDGGAGLSTATSLGCFLEDMLSLPLLLRGALSASEVLAPRVVIDEDEAENVAFLSGEVIGAPVGDNSLLMRRSTFSGRTISLRRSRETFVPTALARTVSSLPILHETVKRTISEATGDDCSDPDSWFSPAFFTGVTSYLGFGAATFANIELSGLSKWQRAIVQHSQASNEQLCGPEALSAAWKIDESEAATMLSQSIRRGVVALLEGDDTTTSFVDLLQISPSSLATAPTSSRLPLLHASLWARRRVEREGQLRTISSVNGRRCHASWRPVYGRDLRDAVSLSAVAGHTSRPLSVWQNLEEDGLYAAACCSVEEKHDVMPVVEDGTLLTNESRKAAADSLFGSPADALDFRSQSLWRRSHSATYRGGLSGQSSLARPCEVVLVSQLAAAPGALQPCKSWSSSYRKLRHANAQPSGSWASFSTTLRGCVRSYEERLADALPVICRFTFAIPKAQASSIKLTSTKGGVIDTTEFPAAARAEATRHAEYSSSSLHDSEIRFRLSFPDRRLVQFDCGKLQALDQLLRDRKAGAHRCLIFTQMTRMLDILEEFLTLHGHSYLRLDGSTKVEDRQRLMDRFNKDSRVFVFILSTRSGGLGINLTGADTVIFYDSDWNPAMDAQAQDRAHRIGQTRDVHIYRLVSAATIEENILLKAKQKRQLAHMSLEEGQFTTAALFSSVSVRDLLNSEDEPTDSTSSDQPTESPAMKDAEFMRALAAAEDDDDRAASKAATAEASADIAEFDETSSSWPAAGSALHPGSGGLSNASKNALGRRVDVDDEVDDDPTFPTGVSAGNAIGAVDVDVDGKDMDHAANPALRHAKSDSSSDTDADGDDRENSDLDDAKVSDDGESDNSDSQPSVHDEVKKRVRFRNDVNQAEKADDGMPNQDRKKLAAQSSSKNAVSALDRIDLDALALETVADEEGLDATSKVALAASASEPSTSSASATVRQKQPSAQALFDAATTGTGPTRMEQRDRVAIAMAKFAVVEASLQPAERYALSYRESRDPHPWVAPEVLREVEATFAVEERAWELEQLQAMADEEERAAEADAELLQLSNSQESVLEGAKLYTQTLCSLRHGIKVRAATGTAWEEKLDETRQEKFFYNIDTKEAVWEKPFVLRARDAQQRARTEGYAGLHHLPAVALRVMRFLAPAPDRLHVAALVCRSWHALTEHPALHKFVRQNGGHGGSADAAEPTLDPFAPQPSSSGSSDLHGAHLSEPGWSPPRRVFDSIVAALSAAVYGDTIVVESGSHYVHHPLEINKAVRIVSQGVRGCLFSGTGGNNDTDDREWLYAAGAWYPALSFMPPSVARQLGLASGYVSDVGFAAIGASLTSEVAVADSAVLRINGPLVWHTQSPLPAAALESSSGPHTVGIESPDQQTARTLDLYTLTSGRSLSDPGPTARARVGGSGQLRGITLRNVRPTLPYCLVVAGPGPVVIVSTPSLARSESVSCSSTSDTVSAHPANSPSVRLTAHSEHSSTTRSCLELAMPVQIFQCDLGNRGGSGASIVANSGAAVLMLACRISSGSGSGILVQGGSYCGISHCAIQDCGSAGITVRSGAIAVSKSKISGCAGPAIRALEHLSAASIGPLADAVQHPVVSDSADSASLLNAIDFARAALVDKIADLRQRGPDVNSSFPALRLLPASVFCSHSDLRGNAGGSWDVPSSMWQAYTAFAFSNQADPVPPSKLAFKAKVASTVSIGDNPASICLPASTLDDIPIDLGMTQLQGGSAAQGINAHNAESADPQSSTALRPMAASSATSDAELLLSRTLQAEESVLSSAPAELNASVARRVTRYTSDGTVPSPATLRSNDAGDSDEDIWGPHALAGKRKRSAPTSSIAVVIDDHEDLESPDDAASRADKGAARDSELWEWLRPSRNAGLAPSRLRAGGGLDGTPHERLHQEALGPAPNRRRLFVHASACSDATVYLVSSAKRRSLLASVQGTHFDLFDSSVASTHEPAAARTTDYAASRLRPDDDKDDQWKRAAVDGAAEAFAVVEKSVATLGTSARVHPYAIVHADAALGGLASVMSRAQNPDSGVDALLVHHRTVAVARLLRGGTSSQRDDVGVVRAATQAKERALVRLASGSNSADHAGGSPRFGSPLQSPVKSDPYAKVYLSAHGQRPDYNAVASAVGTAKNVASCAAAATTQKPKKKPKLQPPQEHGTGASSAHLPTIPQSTHAVPVAGLPAQHIAAYNALLFQQQQQLLLQPQLAALYGGTAIVSPAAGPASSLPLANSPSVQAPLNPSSVLPPQAFGASVVRPVTTMSMPRGPGSGQWHSLVNGMANARGPMGFVGQQQATLLNAVAAAAAAGTLTPDMMTALRYQQAWMLQHQQQLLQQQQQQQLHSIPRGPPRAVRPSLPVPGPAGSRPPSFAASQVLPPRAETTQLPVSGVGATPTPGGITASGMGRGLPPGPSPFLAPGPRPSLPRSMPVFHPRHPSPSEVASAASVAAPSTSTMAASAAFHGGKSRGPPRAAAPPGRPPQPPGPIGIVQPTGVASATAHSATLVQAGQGSTGVPELTARPSQAGSLSSAVAGAAATAKVKKSKAVLGALGPTPSQSTTMVDSQAAAPPATAANNVVAPAVDVSGGVSGGPRTRASSVVSKK